MIKDNLKYAYNYYNISDNLKYGFEWLKSNDLEAIEPNKYILDNNIYANVQIYNTKSDAEFEGHRKYIDIQYIIEGAELIGLTQIDKCKVTKNYNIENDIEFYEKNALAQYYELQKGDFMVLFPNDIHKPSININGEKKVKKVVIKVPIN